MYFYLDEEARKEAEESGKRVQSLLDRRSFEEKVAQNIPPDIRQAIRDLREAEMLPGQEPKRPKVGLIDAIREALKDIGFLIMFLVFILLGNVYLGERAMFYVLSLILLSILVLNSHKLRKLLILGGV